MDAGRGQAPPLRTISPNTQHLTPNTQHPTPNTRVLYIAPYVPSPIRVRPYQILRRLARLGHRITVVALEDGFASESVRRELAGFCEAVHIVPHGTTPAALRCLAALPTKTPLWVAHDHNPALERTVRDILRRERFDIAHVEHLRAAFIAPALGDMPKIIDAVDCITKLRERIAGGASSLAQRTFSHYELGRLRRSEADAYRPYAQIVVTTEAEAAALSELDPTPRLPPLAVIGNGVDSEYFRPDFDGAEVPPESDTVIFSGKLSYVANADSARYLLNEIFPLLRQRSPNARLILAGAAPPASLRRFVRRGDAEIPGYLNDLSPFLRASNLSLPPARVEVTGYVDDLRPYLRRAVAAVCPMLIGGGIQNKALEAMAMARPVVLSPLAARPLQAAVDAGIAFVADTPSNYAETLAELFSDAALAREKGNAAREYVRQHHRWQDAAAQFAALYEDVLGNG